MILTKENLKKFQYLIENDLSVILSKYHPKHVEQYNHFRLRNGRQCPFCRAATKVLFIAEKNRKGDDFLVRLQQNKWDGYE